MELFQSMHNSVLNMKVDDTFNIIDRRFVATVSCLTITVNPFIKLYLS